MKVAILDDYQDVFRTLKCYSRLEGHDVAVYRDSVKEPGKLAERLKGAEAVILAVPHEQYLGLEPDKVVKMAGGPLAVVDAFGILDDARIRRYFELGCEVKGLGRGHIQRIKGEVRAEA